MEPNHRAPQLTYQEMFRRSGLPASVYAELARMLYASFLPLTTIGVATGGIAALIAAETGDITMIVLSGLSLVITALRIVLVLSYRRVSPANADIPVWETRYMIGSFVFSLMLGGVGARAFMLDDATTHMLATALLFAYASGLIMRLCVRPLICLGTLLLAAVPIITVILWRGDPTYLALGGLLIIMIVGGLETAFHMFRNMVSHISTRQKFEQMATRDALTGLPNRLLLDDAMMAGITRSLAEGRLLAVHMLDLDKFKAANDRYGHPVGDAVLVEVARRLTSVLGETDMVARLGGDEFVVVQQQIGRADEAEMLARRIVRTLSEPYRLTGKEIAIGATVGIALAPHDGNDPQQLIFAADAALYVAKEAGRGTVAFHRGGGEGMPVAV